MSKVSKIAATAAVLPVLAFSAPVFADSPGSLAGGSDIYVARNVTTNTSYSSSVATACNDTVKYSVKLSNTDYGQLTNVTVKASLTSGDMSASATTSAGGTTTTSGHVNVSLPTNGSLSYVAGSTSLFAGNGTLIKALADGVTTTGVNAGTLAGSTTEFLQFQAKVNCKEQPKQIQVCELSTKKIITINEDQFDSAKHSKDLTKCQTTPPVTPPTTPPTELVNTGAGSVAGVAAAIAAVSAVAYNVVLRRRAARQ
jgi:hypothetical protein